MLYSIDEYFSNSKSIRDPVHKADIRLSSYEVRIINTRAFQRLRGIKQLGPCELVWHGATHTRFQHSIGTLYVAQRIIDHITSSRHSALHFSQIIIIRLLALLHDIGHIPFGHTIEDERPAIPCRHTDAERVSRLFESEINLVLTELDQRLTPHHSYLPLPIQLHTPSGGQRIQSIAHLLIALITGYVRETGPNVPSGLPPSLDLYQDIVGNTVCADLFDYLRRDAYYTGLRRDYDDRILSHLQISETNHSKLLTLDILSDAEGVGSARTELINLMHMRHALTERVYFNKTKVCAAAMISKAIELAALPDDFLSDQRDDELLGFLERSDRVDFHTLLPNATPQQPTPLAWEEISRPLDNHESGPTERDKIVQYWRGAWLRMKDAPPRDLVGAATLIREYRRRCLYRPVYSIEYAEYAHSDWHLVLERHFHDKARIHFRRAIESFIARMCGLQPSQVIIYCPHRKMNMKYADPTIGPFASSPQYRSLDEVRKGGEPDSRLTALIRASTDVCASHQSLWQFHVLIPPVGNTVTTEQEADARGLCESLFGQYNVARRGSTSASNINTIRQKNALRGLCLVKGSEPTLSEVNGLLAVSPKGTGSAAAPDLFFVEDFRDLAAALTTRDRPPNPELFSQ